MGGNGVEERGEDTKALEGGREGVKEGREGGKEGREGRRGGIEGGGREEGMTKFKVQPQHTPPGEPLEAASRREGPVPCPLLPPSSRDSGRPQTQP